MTIIIRETEYSLGQNPLHNCSSKELTGINMLHERTLLSRSRTNDRLSFFRITSFPGFVIRPEL
jgi:hypothetical protein